MFYLQGKVVGIREKTIKGPKGETTLQVIQVMTGSDRHKQIHDVEDFNHYDVAVGGDIELAVYISPYSTKTGFAGLNIKTVKQADS